VNAAADAATIRRIDLADEALADYRQWEANRTPWTDPSTPLVMAKVAAALDLLLGVTGGGR
jgi:hypothetical protein